jgi:hypothetical protein
MAVATPKSLLDQLSDLIHSDTEEESDTKQLIEDGFEARSKDNESIMNSVFDSVSDLVFESDTTEITSTDTESMMETLFSDPPSIGVPCETIESRVTTPSPVSLVNSPSVPECVPLPATETSSDDVNLDTDNVEASEQDIISNPESTLTSKSVWTTPSNEMKDMFFRYDIKMPSQTTEQRLRMLEDRLACLESTLDYSGPPVPVVHLEPHIINDLDIFDCM